MSDPEVEADNQAGKHDLKKIHVYKFALKGMAANIPNSKVYTVKNDPNVAYVFPDLKGRPKGITIEPFFIPEFYDAASRRVTHMEPSWPLRLPLLSSDVNLVENTGQGVGIAILDSGVDRSHPDLRIGAAPEVKGYSTIESCHDCIHGQGHDAYGFHGTAMAGVIYSQPNVFGLIGIAPGASLFDVRVYDEDVGR